MKKTILIIIILHISIQDIQNKGYEFKESQKPETMLLSKLIQSECGICPPKDKELVGASVLNRITHPSYPNTMKEVIFQKNQYYFNKNIRVDSSTIEISKKLLEGGHNKKVRYFWNHNSKGFGKKPLIITKHHNYA